MPLSQDRAGGMRVLLLSAEDNFARVTLRRLENAGFDINNLHIMRRFRTLSDESMGQFEVHMQSWKPDLVIIDTVSAYMGSERDMHRQNEVGEFLAGLNEIAENIGCAIIGVAHLNKQSTDNPLYRIVGSIGFAASIRSALFLGKDPDNPQRLALAHGKANGVRTAIPTDRATRHRPSGGLARGRRRCKIYDRSLSAGTECRSWAVIGGRGTNQRMF